MIVVASRSYSRRLSTLHAQLHVIFCCPTNFGRFSIHFLSLFISVNPLLDIGSQGMWMYCEQRGNRSCIMLHSSISGYRESLGLIAENIKKRKQISTITRLLLIPLHLESITLSNITLRRPSQTSSSGCRPPYPTPNGLPYYYNVRHFFWLRNFLHQECSTNGLSFSLTPPSRQVRPTSRLSSASRIS